jgi:hypothetical protein
MRRTAFEGVEVKPGEASSNRDRCDVQGERGSHVYVRDDPRVCGLQYHQDKVATWMLERTLGSHSEGKREAAELAAKTCQGEAS